MDALDGDLYYALKSMGGEEREERAVPLRPGGLSADDDLLDESAARRMAEKVADEPIWAGDHG